MDFSGSSSIRGIGILGSPWAPALAFLPTLCMTTVECLSERDEELGPVGSVPVTASDSESPLPVHLASVCLNYPPIWLCLLAL